MVCKDTHRAGDRRPAKIEYRQVGFAKIPEGLRFFGFNGALRLFKIAASLATPLELAASVVTANSHPCTMTDGADVQDILGYLRNSRPEVQLH